MLRFRSWQFGGAFIVAAWLANAAAGQDDYHLASTSESRETSTEADLLARVAALEAQIKSGPVPGYEAHGGGFPEGGGFAEGGACGGGGGCGCGCESCGGCSSCDCGCCCDPCCRSEGFYYGAELGFLQPHNSSGVGLNAFSATASVAILGAGPGAIPLFDGSIDPDFETAPRVWVGYQRCDGLGVRARWWQFDHGFSGDATLLGVVVPGANVFHDWDTWVGDLEVTDSTRLGCNWDATLSYGYRHVEYDETRGINVPGTFFYAAQKKFDGDGVTASAEFRRQATCNLGLYANVRGSILVADDHNSVTVGIGGVGTFSLNERQTNDIKYIFETQAGVEYTMPICGGGWYYARAGVEFQYWDNFGVSPIAVLFDESSGFAGFTISAGLMR